jgi:hypothetical protein
MTDPLFSVLFVAVPWTVVPFEAAQPAYHEEKARNWTLSISCFLFGVLNFKASAEDEQKNAEDLVLCLRVMTGYLKQARKRDGEAQHSDVEFTVALWTRVLSHRPILGVPAIQLLRRGRNLDDNFYVALRDLLDVMDGVTIQNHSSPSLSECKDSIWALRLLAGQVSVSFYSLLSEVGMLIDGVQGGTRLIQRIRLGHSEGHLCEWAVHVAHFANLQAHRSRVAPCRRNNASVVSHQIMD